MPRTLFSTGSAYEPRVGCSRAVRSGDLLTVSATAPLARDGTTTAAPDAYGQAKRCLEIIGEVVERAGFSLDDVIKTRVYFTTRTDWESIATAHGEIYARIRPANTLVLVVGLANPEWLVEIEADAVSGNG